MVRSGVRGTLREKHYGAQGDEQCRPANPGGAKEALPHQPPREQKHEQIQQVQVTHGLKGLQAIKLGRQQNDESDYKLEHSVKQKPRTEATQYWKVALTSEAAEPPQQKQRGEYTDPFIPMPRRKVEVVPGVRGLLPCGRSGLEDPAQRQSEGDRGEGSLPLAGWFPEKNDAIGNSEAGHDGMDGAGCGEKYRYQPESSFDHRSDGSKNGGGGEGAGMQVLVHQIQRGTGNRKSEECCYGRDCGPKSGRYLGSARPG